MDVPTQRQFLECLAIARKHAHITDIVWELLPQGIDIEAIGEADVLRRMAAAIDCLDKQRVSLREELHETAVHQWLLHSEHFMAAVAKIFPDPSGRPSSRWCDSSAGARTIPSLVRAERLYGQYLAALEEKDDDGDDSDNSGHDGDRQEELEAITPHSLHLLQQHLFMSALNSGPPPWYSHAVTALAEYAAGGAGARALHARRNIDKYIEQLHAAIKEIEGNKNILREMGLSFAAYENLPADREEVRTYDVSCFPLKSLDDETDKRLFVYRMYWANMQQCSNAKASAIVEMMDMKLFDGYDRRSVERQCAKHTKDRDRMRAQHAAWEAAWTAEGVENRRKYLEKGRLLDGAELFLFSKDHARV